MFIRSERLFLRPAWTEDAAELHTAITHEAVIRNLTRAPWPYQLADAQAFIGGSQQTSHPTLLITQPGSTGSRIIGGVGLHDEDGQTQLGYWLTPSAWGRGYATEAASALLRTAVALGQSNIRAWHFSDNPASGRVLCKLGFRPLGLSEDRYSAGRGSVAPSRGYVLSGEGVVGVDDDDGSAQFEDLQMHAA